MMSGIRKIFLEKIQKGEGWKVCVCVTERRERRRKCEDMRDRNTLDE
jgi:hypothetical protein